MDPLSVISAAAAVLAATAKVTNLILTLKAGIETINEEIEGLFEEVEALQSVVNNVNGCLNTDIMVRAIRKMQEHAPSASIIDLNRHLEHCNRTIERLRNLLVQIGPVKNNNILRRGLQYLKLDDHQEEINRIRQQIQSHRGCLNVSLLNILVCKTMQSDERDQQALNELNDKLDQLSSAISDLGVGQRRMEATVQQVGNVTEDETILLEEMKVIRNSSVALQRQATIEIRRRQSMVVHNRSTAANLASEKVRQWMPHCEVSQDKVSIGEPLSRHVSETSGSSAGRDKRSQAEFPARASSSGAAYFPKRYSPLRNASQSPSETNDEQSSLDIGAFESAMEKAITEAELRRSRQDKPFSDEDFNTISRVLRQAGKSAWSELPRTYLVLRMIEQVDAMDEFIKKGCKDINFPYSVERLPACLRGATAREAFLSKQACVLSEKTAHLVQGGPHRHFSKTSDVGFTIIRTLGSGGHGVIDEVRSKLSLQEYARKRIHRPRLFAKDKRALEVFENEIHNMKKLEHEHLVKFVGSYTDPKYVGIIMEPVAETDLRRYLMRSSFPDQDLANLVSFFGCLCSAICYLHSRSVRHKDIKPANILIKRNRVLITDFGISRDWTDIDKETTSGNPGAYTSAYAAPEVHLHKPRNTSSDIWSLGCVYLDMLTVLKGSTIEQKRDFFARHGSGSCEAWENLESLHAWVNILECESIDHQGPVQWIREMTAEDASLRPDAEMLLQSIRDYSEGRQAYCCIECLGHGSSADTSYRGSDTEEEDDHRYERNSLSPSTTRHSRASTTSPSLSHTGDTNTDYSIDDEAVVAPKNASPHFSRPKLPRFDWQTQTETKVQNKMVGSESTKSTIPDIQISNRDQPSTIQEEMLRHTETAWTAQTFIGREPNDTAIKTEVPAAVVAPVPVTQRVEPEPLKVPDPPIPGVAIGLSPQPSIVNLGGAIAEGAGSGAAPSRYHNEVRQLFLNGSAQLEAVLSQLRDRHPDWKEILFQCVKPNEVSRKFNNMLHVAANFDNTSLSKDIIEAYVGAGVRVNALNFASNNALQYAASRDHSVVVQSLLSAGSDLNHRNVRKHTALHVACMTGSEASVDVLVEEMTLETINMRDHRGLTALLMACRVGSLSIVKALIAKGADITIVDDMENNCLFHCHTDIWREIHHLRRTIKATRTEPEASERNAAEIPHDVEKSTGLARGARQPLMWIKLGTGSMPLEAICPCAVCQISRGVENVLDSNQAPILACPCISHLKELSTEMLIDISSIDEDMEECNCRRCAIARAPCGQTSSVVIPEPRAICECPSCQNDNDAKYYRPDIVSLRRYKGHDYYDAKIAYAAPTMCDCKDCKADSHKEAIQFLASVGFTGSQSYRTDPNKAWMEFIQHIANRKIGAEPMPDLFIDAISYLLDCGANINAVMKKGSTLLHQAVLDGQLCLTKMLIDRGAALNLPTKEGNTAAKLALLSCRPEILRLLLRSGARTSHGGTGLLSFGFAGYGTIGHMVPLILAHDQKVNSISTELGGETLLYIALVHRNAVAMELLMIAGADLEFGTKDIPRLIYLAIATDAISNGSSLTRLFLSRRANVNAINNHPSALHYAARFGSGNIAPVMAALLEYEDCQADINKKDQMGRTPLHCIAESGYQDTSSAVEVMIAAGADLSSEDVTGCTPLHIAARAGNLTLTKLLVAAGALTEVQNNAGKTPSDLAGAKKHREIVEVLGGRMPVKKRWFSRG